jgi:preprotein translocase subunit SecD
MRKRPVAIALAVGGVAIAAVVALLLLDAVALPGAQPSASSSSDPSEGRLRVEYQVLPADGVAPGVDGIAVVTDIVRRRLEAVGITDVSVEVVGPDRIAVVITSVANGTVLRRLVAPTGRLDFVPLGTTLAEAGRVLDLRATPPLFSGDQVASASIGSDGSGNATVDFTLRPEAARVFAEYTASHVGDSFAIALDGRVLTAPMIMSAIEGGEVQVGLAAPDDGPDAIKELVAILEFGSLPWPLREIGTEPVPTAPGG